MDSLLSNGIPPDRFKTRREAAVDRMGSGVMVLPASEIQHASRDSERPYCPDRELYYLTGLTEAQTVAVLLGGEEPRLVLFVRERDPDAELWAGPRLGPERAAEMTGADEAHPLGELESRLPDLLGTGDRIFHRPRGDGVVDRLVREALARARARGARTGSGPRGVVDPGEILDDLRLVKDADELELIRRACLLTTEGHRAGASAIAVGAGEWAVEAAVNAAFRSSGGAGPGFGTIVGSGENACVLHYVDNRARIGADTLVLVDAGAELGLYHGDVTRTYPASGDFTPAQRDVYDLVEAALREGVKAARPGETIAAVHDAATRTLVEGLIELGVLDGDVDGLIEEGAHKSFFPHQTSHWLGLDVHDPGDYARASVSRELVAGMVFTVEPGLYFRPGTSEGGAEPFSGIGIRIEDDVVITDEGCEVLTGSLPTDASAIEALVGS